MGEQRESEEVSLAIRGVYNGQREAVGIDAAASEAFDQGRDMRAKIEICAAITARANCIAAELIGQWDADEQQKQALYEHYAHLKENMLHDLLDGDGDGDGGGGAAEQ